MNVLRTVIFVVLALAVASAGHAQVPVVGGGGAGLAAIAGTETLVTIVLKQNGAKDPNLQVVSVEAGIMTVKTHTGQVTNYRLADVAEVRVQGEVMKVGTGNRMADRGMTTDQQEIVGKALVRVSEIFNGSVGDQTVRMFAAEILAVGGASSATSKDAQGGAVVPKQQAVDYLTALVNGNDLRTGIAAALRMSNAGLDVPVPTIVSDGLASGDRTVKANAARLAGQTHDMTAVSELRNMLQDRAANISAPAVYALTDLGHREILPSLIAMVFERNSEKANAASAGLIALGDEDTVKQLKAKLKDTEGLARFRVAGVLYNLGDDEAGTILRDELMDVPSMRFDAARTLAMKGDIKAMQFLRDWLGQRRDPSELVLNQRALAAHALITAGDRVNAGVLQDVLREGPPSVQIATLQLIADLDVHSLLPMILPVLTSNDAAIVATACQTAVAMAHNDYGDRLRGRRS